MTQGNSGGPLIDVYGQVTGVVTWGRINSQNMNYPVPVSQLKSLKYTIANVQEPSVPIVSGEGGTQERELNDAFDDANVLQFARGSITGTTYDSEDVDTFFFRVDRRTTISMAGGYANNSAGTYWAVGLFDVNGENIRYSNDYFAAFPMPGLDPNEYRQQPYEIYYEIN